LDTREPLNRGAVAIIIDVTAWSTKFLTGLASFDVQNLGHRRTPDNCHRFRPRGIFQPQAETGRDVNRGPSPALVAPFIQMATRVADSGAMVASVRVLWRCPVCSHTKPETIPPNDILGRSGFGVYHATRRPCTRVSGLARGFPGMSLSRTPKEKIILPQKLIRHGAPQR